MTASFWPGRVRTMLLGGNSRGSVCRLSGLRVMPAF